MEDSFGNKCQSLGEWGAHNKISSEASPLDLNKRDVVSPEEKHHKNWEEGRKLKLTGTIIV